MKCISCEREVNIKKNQVVDCECGAKLMCVQIKKELILLNLRNDKGEK